MIFLPLTASTRVTSFYLIKTGVDGNKVWERTFESSWSGAISMQQTSDGGYIIAGAKQPDDKDRKGTYMPEDAYLIKTNEFGNV